MNCELLIINYKWKRIGDGIFRSNSKMIKSIIENKNEIKFVIEPRKYKTDLKLLRLSLLFWVFWTPLTLYCTYYAFTENNIFIFFWLLIGYFGIFFVPYTIYCKNRSQTLLIEGEILIVLGTEFFPKTKILISKENLRSLSLERELNENEKVYNRSLRINYVHKNKEKYVMFAHFVHPSDQFIIFEEIRQFLKSNGFSFETKVELPMGNDE